MKRRDLTNQRFGRLVAKRVVGKTKWQNLIWQFECDCGNLTEVASGSVINGDTQSCGCLAKDRLINRSYKHGLIRSGAYTSWRKMKDRCQDKKDISYPNYGGRGVKVCEEWQTFDGFYKDMGKRPEGKSLDRIDPNGNYEPNNCRWASHKEQRANRRDSNVIRENPVSTKKT